VLSLFKDAEDNVHFKIRRGGAIERMERSMLISLYVEALLDFYAKYLEFYPTKS
jgi:hypothetical protein